MHYDAIFVGAYRQPYVPFYMVTREFFDSVRSHLRPGGGVIISVGHLPGSDALEKVVPATVGADFRYVMRDPVNTGNSLVIASSRPLSAPRIIKTGVSGRSHRISIASPRPSGDAWPRRCAAGGLHRRPHPGRMAD